MMKIEHDTWPLPNMKQVEPKEFWHHSSIWGVPKSTYIQRQNDVGGWFTPIVFIIDANELLGGGFVVKSYYSGPAAGDQEFFEWRKCDHDFEHKSGGSCYHIHTCKKCGARYDVDSSD